MRDTKLRQRLTASALLALFCSPSGASAQDCASEQDCVNGGACVGGACVEPVADEASSIVLPPATAPDRTAAQGSAPPARPGLTDEVTVARSSRADRFFQHGYLSVAGLWSVGGTGGFYLTPENGERGADDVSGSFVVQAAHGFRLAAYFVPARVFHLGVFLDWGQGRALLSPDGGTDSIADFTLVDTGLTLKVGGGAGRAFIAFATDLGVASRAAAQGRVQHGLTVFPRLSIDVLTVRGERAKMAVFLAFGPNVSVLAGYDDPEKTYRGVRWAVTPTLLVGGSFGG